MEVRVILELEPQTSPRSQGHHLCKALLGHIMGMEDPSNPMEQGGVQVSKPMKVKKILFYLSLFLQTSVKIAQRVMLSLYQDGLGLVLVHTGWKGTENGSSTNVAPTPFPRRDNPTSCFTNSSNSLWKRPGLLIFFFKKKKDLNHRMTEANQWLKKPCFWFQPLYGNVRDAPLGQFGNAQLFGQLRAILL